MSRERRDAENKAVEASCHAPAPGLAPGEVLQLLRQGFVRPGCGSDAVAQPVALGLHGLGSTPVKRNAPAGNDLFVDGLGGARFREDDGGTRLVHGQPQQPGAVPLVEGRR